jgi:hypothetical protein
LGYTGGAHECNRKAGGANRETGPPGHAGTKSCFTGARGGASRIGRQGRGLSQ